MYGVDPVLNFSGEMRDVRILDAKHHLLLNRQVLECIRVSVANVLWVNLRYLRNLLHSRLEIALCR